MNLYKMAAGLIAGCILFIRAAEGIAVPAAPQRDVSYILGLYYGNGENILIRENNGELQLFYRLPGDKCFGQSNMFSLRRNRFDHYSMTEAGPMSQFGEVSVKFERDAEGYGVALRIGGHVYTRMFFQGDRPDIAPERLPSRSDWSPLRFEANRLSVPPSLVQGVQEPLVDLKTFDALKLKSIYATQNNLFGAPLYTLPKLYLVKSAALALNRAQQELSRYGYGLVVWDAYRPWSVSKLASMALPDKQKDWLENPDKEGSPHNTGRAVDVGLFDLRTGEETEMISGFDEPSMRQYRNYPGGSTRQRYLRQLLREVMENAGFTGVEHEWWHYEYRKDVQYAHLNIPLEELK